MTPSPQMLAALSEPRPDLLAVRADLDLHGPADALERLRDEAERKAAMFAAQSDRALAEQWRIAQAAYGLALSTIHHRTPRLASEQYTRDLAAWERDQAETAEFETRWAEREARLSQEQAA